MLEPLFFILGLINNLFLIVIFLIRKTKNMTLMGKVGRLYFLLAIPAVFEIYLVIHGHQSVRYTIFLAIFLAYLFLEALFDHILKIDFRSNWKLLVPYLALYYAMLYGFMIMVWKYISLTAGIIMLVLTIIQIAVNLMTHQKRREIVISKTWRT